jgi:hypothetical protein
MRTYEIQVHPMLRPIEEIFETYNDCHSTGETATQRALHSAGIFLMQDFLDFTHRELMCIPKMGKLRLRLVVAYLAEHGYELREEGQFWPTPEEVAQRFGGIRIKRAFSTSGKTAYDTIYGKMCWENIQAWVRDNPPRCYSVRDDI